MQATAIAHPNIALVKYWGKSDVEENLPAVGSLSITLDRLTTTTRVIFDETLSADRFLLAGGEAPAMAARVSACLDDLRKRAASTSMRRSRATTTFPRPPGWPRRRRDSRRWWWPPTPPWDRV